MLTRERAILGFGIGVGLILAGILGLVLTGLQFLNGER